LRLGKECLPVTVCMDGFSEIIVEFLRDIAREFQVLFLVLPYWHMGCPVNENVGGHECWISVEADRCILPVFSRLLLELSHTVEPAQAGDAVEDPGKLGVLSNLALIENYVFGRIDAAGDESGGHFARVLRQFLGAAPDG